LSICLNRTNPRGSKWVWESAKKSKKNNHAESRWITRVLFPQAVSYGLITLNHAQSRGLFFQKNASTNLLALMYVILHHSAADRAH
jgi:hypothetical protein